jgi:hypothetical protein
MAGVRPRRTREHVIAAQSHNYVEKFFIDRGHVVSRPGEDYGTDVLVTLYDESGYLEPGSVFLQLKASDSLNYSINGSYISFRIEIKHYNSWMAEPAPVFLVLYDATKVKAYWLYVQEHFESRAGARPKKSAKTVTVRVPTKNVFTARTVDYIRDRNGAVQDQIKGVSHDA